MKLILIIFSFSILKRKKATIYHQLSQLAHCEPSVLDTAPHLVLLIHRSQRVITNLSLAIRRKQKFRVSTEILSNYACEMKPSFCHWNESHTFIRRALTARKTRLRHIHDATHVSTFSLSTNAVISIKGTFPSAMGL